MADYPYKATGRTWIKESRAVANRDSDEALPKNQIESLASSGGSGTSRTVTTTTTDYTASDGEIVAVDASSSTVTVTLPTPTAGGIVDIYAEDATNGITIQRSGTGLIRGLNIGAGGTTQYLLGSNGGMQFVSDGTDHYVYDSTEHDHSGESLGAPEPLDSIRTIHSHTEERGPDAVVWVDSSFKVWASGPDGVIDSGFDASAQLQAAIDWVAANNYGNVLIKDRLPLESVPVQVKTGVTLNCDRSGELVNNLSTANTPCVEFDPYTHFDRLRIDCQGNSGAIIGSSNTQQSTFGGTLDIYNVGPGCIGLDTNGYYIDINQIHIQGGNDQSNTSDGSTEPHYASTGIDISNTSDIFLGKTIFVSHQDALVADTVEHGYLGQIDCDTGVGTAVQLDNCRNMNIPALSVWCNSSATDSAGWSGGAVEWGMALALGSNTVGPNRNLRIGVNVMRSGPTGMTVANTIGSTIDAVITNHQAFPTAPAAMVTGLSYGTSVGDDVSINATVDPTVTNMIAGTPSGTLNGVAYEASGAGASPTPGNWPEHRTIENTDDGTVWIKISDGTMVRTG